MSTIPKRRPGNISFVRFKSGISQQQLADALGVSRSTIAMVETGKRKLSGPVALIYQDMCHSAAALNPGGYTRIKRGRKPSCTKISFVTNYGNRARAMEQLGEGLKQKKEMLNYLHMGLQFKRRSTEERFRRFSNQMDYVTAMLKVSKEVLDKLPGNKWRDKYELREAVFYAKQVKLKQQLKKYGPVRLLAVEFQANILEGKMKLIENTIAGLQDRNKTNENRNDGIRENNLENGPTVMIAA